MRPRPGDTSWPPRPHLDMELSKSRRIRTQSHIFIFSHIIIQPKNHTKFLTPLPLFTTPTTSFLPSLLHSRPWAAGPHWARLGTSGPLVPSSAGGDTDRFGGGAARICRSAHLLLLISSSSSFASCSYFFCCHTLTPGSHAESTDCGGTRLPLRTDNRWKDD